MSSLPISEPIDTSWPGCTFAAKLTTRSEKRSRSWGSSNAGRVAELMHRTLTPRPLAGAAEWRRPLGRVDEVQDALEPRDLEDPLHRAALLGAHERQAPAVLLGGAVGRHDDADAAGVHELE